MGNERGRVRATKLRRAEAGPAPTQASLHEAALVYLGRSAATEAVLARVLERRVAAWARKAAREGQDPDPIESAIAGCREAIARIVARFREVGLVNDAAFAAARAQSLSRSGRSRRAIAAHLAAKGVGAEIVREAVPDGHDAELAAALTFTRKRRIGPFARDEEDREARRKAIAAMARAGFSWSVCERALGMDRDQAEQRIAAHRS